MAESAAFEALCDSLEQTGALDRLAARGTVRLALKQAGLEPKTATARQIGVVLEKLLPAELRARGVSEPEERCARIAKALESVRENARTETPETIFARLGS